MKRLFVNEYGSEQNRRIIANFSPTQIITLGFIMLILAGALLLNLPISSRNGASAGFANALFTSTSATCVTGLVVVDTYAQWSAFGQLVIISLIQIGGLGIMSLATFFWLLLGRKIGLKERLVMQESISEHNLSGIVRVLKKILIITFIIEGFGAAALAFAFIPAFGVREGIVKSVFHSISAFCNAGFDLMGGFRSLTDFNSNPIVIFTVTSLAVLGGLGFIVWRDMGRNRRWSHFSLHTKVVLLAVISLIISGVLLFLIFEYTNPATMGPLPFHTKLMNAYFHSVTSRTAGYNALPIESMTASSKLLIIMFMFIGAAPGSTAGGVKVTTVSVILFAVFSTIRGEEEVNILKRRVPEHIIRKALAITAISLLLIVIMAMILLTIEKKPFIDVLFEVVSAFGTAGLSTGLTPELHTASKYALILTMYLGRVGPFSAAIALALRRGNRTLHFKYPEGKIVVG